MTTRVIFVSRTILFLAFVVVGLLLAWADGTRLDHDELVSRRSKIVVV